MSLSLFAVKNQYWKNGNNNNIIQVYGGSLKPLTEWSDNKDMMQ